MTNEQLIKNMGHVGKTCFTTYFTTFSDLEIPTKDVNAMLHKSTGYTKKACASRVNHARRIIRAGLAKEALEMIALSTTKKISAETKAQARLLLKEYSDVR